MVNAAHILHPLPSARDNYILRTAGTFELVTCDSQSDSVTTLLKCFVNCLSG